MGNSNSSRDTTTAANDDGLPPPPQAFDYYDDIRPVSAGDGPTMPFRRSSSVSLLGKRSGQTETIWGRGPMILGHRCSPATLDRPRGRSVADSAMDEALAKTRIEEALATAMERSTMERLPRAMDQSAMDRLQQIFNGTFVGDNDTRETTAESLMKKMQLEEEAAAAADDDIQPPQLFDVGLGDDGEQGYHIRSLAAYVPMTITTSLRRDEISGSDGGGSVADGTRAEALAKMRAEEAAAAQQLEEALARAPPGIQRLREMFGCVVRPGTTVAPDTDQLAAITQMLAAAEDLWASGHLALARSLVHMAMDVEPFSGFQEVRRAHNAYDVLAASSKSNGKADHDYVVLGVAMPPCGCTPAHADVKARYEEQRALFDPDKTGDNSLAVACALHLVNLAFDRITDMEQNATSLPLCRRPGDSSQDRFV